MAWWRGCRGRRGWIPLVSLALLGAAALPAPAAAEHRLGVGAHYWRTLDDLEDEGFDEIDDSGIAWLLTYQYVPVGLFKLEVDLEYFKEGFGGATDAAVSPQVFVVLGGSLYAALGAGVIYSEGFEEEWSDVYYAARIGWDLNLLPRTHLDLNANYQFAAWEQLDEADTDSITLGAALRFAF
jgi:hypothetical protein